MFKNRAAGFEVGRTQPAQPMSVGGYVCAYVSKHLWLPVSVCGGLYRSCLCPSGSVRVRAALYSTVPVPVPFPVPVCARLCLLVAPAEASVWRCTGSEVGRATESAAGQPKAARPRETHPLGTLHSCVYTYILRIYIHIKRVRAAPAGDTYHILQFRYS